MTNPSAGRTGPAKRATRADVAERAGVSTAVVSYVINRGPKRVSPATEQRVRDAVAQAEAEFRAEVGDAVATVTTIGLETWAGPAA